MVKVEKYMGANKRSSERADSSTAKKPRKAKEPETPETLEKKKLQKELDNAMKKVTKATETLTEEKVAEDFMKTGVVAKRFLDDATKKREKSEKKLKNLQDEATDLKAKFEQKFPPDAALALAA